MRIIHTLHSAVFSISLIFKTFLLSFILLEVVTRSHVASWTSCCLNCFLSDLQVHCCLDPTSFKHQDRIQFIQAPHLYHKTLTSHLPLLSFPCLIENIQEQSSSSTFPPTLWPSPLSPVGRRLFLLPFASEPYPELLLAFVHSNTNLF